MIINWVKERKDTGAYIHHNFKEVPKSSNPILDPDLDLDLIFEDKISDLSSRELCSLPIYKENVV